MPDGLLFRPIIKHMAFKYMNSHIFMQREEMITLTIEIPDEVFIFTLHRSCIAPLVFKAFGEEERHLLGSWTFLLFLLWKWQTLARSKITWIDLLSQTSLHTSSGSYSQLCEWDGEDLQPFCCIRAVKGSSTQSSQGTWLQNSPCNPNSDSFCFWSVFFPFGKRSFINLIKRLLIRREVCKRLIAI